jgi:hypothetical protein
MHKGMLLLTSLILLLVTGCTTVEVAKAPAADCDPDNIMKDNGCKKTEGIPYYLPRTAIKLQFPVIKTTETEPTLFSEARKVYAAKKVCKWPEPPKKSSNECKEADFQAELKKQLEAEFKVDKDSVECINLKNEADKLGIDLDANKSIFKPDVSFKLDEVGVSTEAEPDPEELYFIKLKGGVFEKRNIEVSYSPGGVINQYSASTEDKTLEFAVNTLTAVTNAAINSTKIPFISVAKHVPLVEPRSEETDIKCSAPIDEKYKNLFLRAMKGLEFIKSFPDSRTKELQGQNNSNISKEALELRLKELDAIKNASMAIFQNVKKSETKTYTISLLPSCSSEDINCSKKILTTNLAKFSKSCGLFADTVESDYAYSIDMPKRPKDQPQCEAETQIAIKLNNPPHLNTASADPKRFKNLMDKDKKRGMYYRVPLTIRMTVTNKDEAILVKDLAIAQLGVVASLPAETGSTNVSYKVTLDPVTGMLLKVSLTSEGANTNVGKNVIDPIANYLEAKKESKDEVTKLEREEAILKLKKSIKELKEAVGE